MSARQGLIAGMALLAAAAAACTKENSQPSEKVAASATSAQEGSVPAESVAGTASAHDRARARRLTEKPAEPLLDAPLERRLYSDRIEASSFLWVNYNRFQENYHANYVMDGDPSTAWVEGADANGLGEWIRIKTSAVAETNRLRLRLLNGYHKSQKLFKQNARAAEIEIKTLPGGTTKVFALEDSMDWQELAIDLDAERLEGFELKVVAAFDGSKYEDLCISEVEVYATGRTQENPAFEAKKLEQIATWKQARLDAAKIFASVAAKELPIHSGYRVEEGAGVTRRDVAGDLGTARATVAALKAGAGKDAALFDRADAALAANFNGWNPHSISVKNPIAIPEVDGLKPQSSETLTYGWPSDSFVVPLLKSKSLVQNQRISLMQLKDDFDPIDGDECKAGQTQAIRPPGAVGPNATELLVFRCVEEEERDSVYTRLVWELYEYDDDGWLRLIVGEDRAQYLDWQRNADGVILAGGLRLESWSNKFTQLVAKPQSP